MRRIRVVLGVAVVMAAAVALTAGAALAQAETGTINEQIPFSGEETVNECTGEPVTIEGTIHTLFHTTNTENGGMHFVGHFNVQGRGVSPSGAKYVLVSGDNFIVNGEFAPEPVEQTRTVEGHIMVLR